MMIHGQGTRGDALDHVPVTDNAVRMTGEGLVQSQRTDTAQGTGGLVQGLMIVVKAEEDLTQSRLSEIISVLVPDHVTKGGLVQGHRTTTGGLVQDHMIRREGLALEKMTVTDGPGLLMQGKCQSLRQARLIMKTGDPDHMIILTRRMEGKRHRESCKHLREKTEH